MKLQFNVSLDGEDGQLDFNVLGGNRRELVRFLGDKMIDMIFQASEVLVTEKDTKEKIRYILRNFILLKLKEYE